MKLCIFSCLCVRVFSICSQERDDRGSLNHNGIYWSGSIRDSRVTTSQIEETGNNLNSLQRLEKGKHHVKQQIMLGVCCSSQTQPGERKQLGAHRNKENWGDTVKVIPPLSPSSFFWMSKKHRQAAVPQGKNQQLVYESWCSSLYYLK